MITLCVSTFNRAELLDQMLASFEKEIRKTRNVLTEFVILLNGCTDNSEDVATRWQVCFEELGVKTIVSQNDPPLYILDSYTRAVRLANNKYVWFFGDDDAVDNDVLARLSEVIGAYPDIGTLALNYQMLEFDLKTPIGLPKLPPGIGGRYNTWFDFARLAGIMPMGLLSAMIVQAEPYLASPIIRESKFRETTYHHLCAMIENLGSMPLYALEPVCVLNRLNHRLDMEDRTSKPLAVQALAQVNVGMALVRAFEEIGCHRDLIERHKVDNTNNVRYAWLLLVIRSSLPPGDWNPLRRKLRTTYSASWIVQTALAVDWLVPSAVIHWFTRDRLRPIHRTLEKLRVTGTMMFRSIRRRNVS